MYLLGGEIERADPRQHFVEDDGVGGVDVLPEEPQLVPVHNAEAAVHELEVVGVGAIAQDEVGNVRQALAGAAAEVGAKELERASKDH